MVATAVTIFAYLPRSSCECPFMQATYLPTYQTYRASINSFQIEEKPQRWMHHHTSQPARVSADNFSTCDALLLLSWMAWCEHLPARNMIPVHQPSATASIASEKREATRPPNCQPSASSQQPGRYWNKKNTYLKYTEHYDDNSDTLRVSSSSSWLAAAASSSLSSLLSSSSTS